MICSIVKSKLFTDDERHGIGMVRVIVQGKYKWLTRREDRFCRLVAYFGERYKNYCRTDWAEQAGYGEGKPFEYRRRYCALVAYRLMRLPKVRSRIRHLMQLSVTGMKEQILDTTKAFDDYDE